MTRLILCSIALLTIYAAAASAQITNSAPREDVVRISTNLIQLDVSVVDRHGKTVADLQSGEIEVLENGRPQDLKGLTFISKAGGSKVTRGKDTLDTAPALSQPLSSTPARRVIALVVDDISLSFESSRYVRQAVKKFVEDQMAEDDLVAILRTGVSTGFLQQFTSDKTLLLAAVETIRWNPTGNGGISALEQKDENVKNLDIGREREEALATASLNALNHMIRRMSILPGRKSVIFLSDGFSLLTRNESGFVDTSRVLESIRRITDSANRSAVVVYTIDARGLEPANFTAADKPATSIQASNAVLAGRRQVLSETQDGLRVLAREAGGFAVVNTNGISDGVERILDDQGYYLIAYEPDTETFDAKTSRFNRIEVKVKRDGLRARYRSGFFNQPSIPAVAAGKETSLVSALVSPFIKTDIDLRLQSVYAKDDVGGAVVRSFLHIPGSDLTFAKQVDGKLVADFEIVAMSFANDGSVADQIARNYKIETLESGHAKLLREGIVYYFTFAIGKPGAYQYRVAVRDRASRRIGTAGQFLNVPDDKDKAVTLSGIGLESISKAEWAAGLPAANATQSNALRDTSLRKFERGSVLVYGAEVYRRKEEKPVPMTSQIRLFREGQLLRTGAVSPIAGQDSGRAPISGAFELGPDLVPGEYILQVVVRAGSGGRNSTETQSVLFEIVDEP